MRPVWLGFGLGGAGGLALVIVWAERLAGPWMWTLGLSLGQLLAPSVGQAREVEVDWEAVEREVTAADVPPPVSAGEAPKGTKSKSTPKATQREGGALFVSAERVLALSTSARVPASRYVPASGKRPAGLQVAGVGGLGIGVKDGDVLTKVAGAEVRSSAAVISAVLKLRARKAKAISGEFWRGQERWQIVFEMPYLEPRAAAAGLEAKPADHVPSATSPAPPVAATPSTSVHTPSPRDKTAPGKP